MKKYDDLMVYNATEYISTTNVKEFMKMNGIFKNKQIYINKLGLRCDKLRTSLSS